MQEDEGLGGSGSRVCLAVATDVTAPAPPVVGSRHCHSIDSSHALREADAIKVPECLLGARERQSALRDATSVGPSPPVERVLFWKVDSVYAPSNDPESLHGEPLHSGLMDFLDDGEIAVFVFDNRSGRAFAATSSNGSSPASITHPICVLLH